MISLRPRFSELDDAFAEMKISELGKIVDFGYCSGCGACTYNSDISMQLNEFGEYIPKFAEGVELSPSLDRICPFLSPDLNENFLAEERFGSSATFHPEIGYYRRAFGAFVKEKDFRNKGTSGGIGTWLGVELFKLGLIDGVIHAKRSIRENEDDPFFKYGISKDVQSIREGARTRYHVLEMSDVLEQVKTTPGRYLFIGVPCFCKALRRIQRFDPIISERIPYVISLVCGHYKSMHWSLSLGWAVGIPPDEMSEIDYRIKGPNIPSRSYVFRAKGGMNNVVECESGKVVGGKFNSGAMMLKACEYCDDVVGETADLTIGDAWLPKFDIHNGGTNLLVTRNPEIEEIILKANTEDRIDLREISADEAARSQSGGFRQRREGLAYRLWKAEQDDVWVPEKRVRPERKNIGKLRRKIYDERSRVAAISKLAFKDALANRSYFDYSNSMKKAFGRLRQLEICSSFLRIVYGKLERFLRKYLKIS